MNKSKITIPLPVIILLLFVTIIAWSNAWDDNLHKEMKAHPLPTATERCCVNQ